MEEVKRGRPAKKKKMTKIEGQPKRATSSYFIWMNATREEIKADLPSGSSIGDIAKSAGERWKSMSDSDKKVIVDYFNITQRARKFKKV